METPELFQTGYYNTEFTSEKQLISDVKNGEHFVVDDLLDLPNDDGMVTEDTLDLTVIGNSTDCSVVDNSCNSSLSGSNHPPQLLGYRDFPDGHLSTEFAVPYEDMAELEWLSNFVEESFSSNELHKMQMVQAMRNRTDSEIHQFIPDPNRASATSSTIFKPEMPVPAKARSKRSRMAPGNWASRLLVVSPNTTTPDSSMDTISMQDMSSSSESGMIIPSSGKKTVKSSSTPKKKESNIHHVPSNNNGSNSEGRKCLHCATDKTPQWRTGPLGPKTLCNACGVRYKSGRLVPEYRPAASPTFMLTKHSNSHRKVLEIRRQKEVTQVEHQHQHQFLPHNMMFDVSNADDYLIHQHMGPDFRQLI
ncbi:GATA transcription factor 12 [Solanum tuberosum]|uniref:GATA transcription factor n=1 Tax=Solanum tuberosum TaxID=4113 RepID=M1CUD6_SOLTU|nr:PREDICTED: GATA transcription factor 12 [Solanum tuberosum]